MALLPLFDRTIVVPLAGALLVGCAIAATCTVADEVPSADEQQIRAAVAEFVKRYNAHQPDKLAELFAVDARFVFRDGSQVDGRDAIRQSFADEFAAQPQSAISVVVDSIRLLTPDVAVEEGTSNSFPDGDTLTYSSRYVVLHLKRDNRWLMQSVRIVEEQSRSAYDHLRQLQWLIGDWVDEGAEEVVETSFRWDENKSFLLEEFRVLRDGAVVLKGTQRIGWDPQSRQIRSWMFDGAGGFGQAVWTPVEDGWVCKATGVTAEGLSASATRTLTRISVDHAIWTATDRLLGETRLPDLSITMARRPQITP